VPSEPPAALAGVTDTHDEASEIQAETAEDALDLSMLPSVKGGSNLASKLAKILGAVGWIPKLGWNDFHKYHYTREQDIVEAVRHLLSEAGVFVFTSIESIERRERGKDAIITTVKVKHTFVDGDSGETFPVFSAGDGEDKGDKGIYKAFTGAMKYFLLKSFLMPTGDDPERDANGNGGHGQNPRKPAPARRQEPPQTAEQPGSTGTNVSPEEELRRRLRRLFIGEFGNDLQVLGKALASATENRFRTLSAMDAGAMKALDDGIKAGRISLARIAENLSRARG
jgi:hypothetical protein